MPDTDDTLLDHLRQAARGHGDHVPAPSRAAARAAFTWRTVDDELARLGYDSTLDATGGGVRGDGPRLLSFEAPGVAIDLEVTARGLARALLGQATGAIATLELQRPDGSAASTTTIDVDAHGAFAADAVDPGVVRLRCLLSETAGGPRVVSTEWIAI
jgi:hypothetical protein